MTSSPPLFTLILFFAVSSILLLNSVQSQPHQLCDHIQVRAQCLAHQAERCIWCDPAPAPWHVRCNAKEPCPEYGFHPDLCNCDDDCYYVHGGAQEGCHFKNLE